MSHIAASRWSALSKLTPCILGTGGGDSIDRSQPLVIRPCQWMREMTSIKGVQQSCG